MTTKRLLYFTALAAALALAAAYFLVDFNIGIGVVAFLGALELVSLSLGWRWVTPVLFLVFAVLSMVVILLSAPPYLSLTSVVCMLVTWDLEHFRQRLERIRNADTARAIERSHLLHLLAVTAAGVLLAAAALLLRIHLVFASALILSALVVLGLSQVVVRLAGRYRPPKKAPRAPLE